MNDLRVNKYIIDESKQWLDETRRNNTISYKGSSVLDSGLTTPLHHGSRCLSQWVLRQTWCLRLTQRKRCSTVVYRLTTPLYIMLIAQLWYCTVTLWLELGVGSKLVCWRGSSNCIDCKISLQYSLRRKGSLQFTSVSVSRNHSSDIILFMNTSSLSKLFLILCYAAFSASSSSWPVPNPI